MSKYDALWAHIQNCGQPQLTLTFDEIGRIAGTPLDHSFLSTKKSCSHTATRSKKSP